MTRSFCALLVSVVCRSKVLYQSTLLSLIIVLLSCNSASQHKKELPGSNTTRIELTAPAPLPAQEHQRLHAASEAWFDSALKLKNFNGGMIVAKNGNIVFEVYNGNAHVGSTDAITDSTPLHIASVTKTFTAMAVLRLWQEGKLNIDDEFSKYFPQFNYPGITVRDMLSHRSGLPNYLYFMELLGWDKNTFITNEDVLSYMVDRKAEIKDISLPGIRFNYCNTNYALLALLIEKITGKSYGEYLKQTFFGPLGMKHSFVFSRNDSATGIPSYDYRGGEIPMNFLDLVYGDKNIYSTPRDLLTWDKALTSGILFNEKTLAEAYAPYSNERPGVRNYGLGWRMNIYPTGKKMIYHNGWWHGNNAAFIRLLEDTATIIVLGNKYNKGIYHANQLSNLFGNYFAGRESGEEAVRTAPPVARKKAAAKPGRKAPAKATKIPVATAKKKSTKKKE